MTKTNYTSSGSQGSFWRWLKALALTLVVALLSFTADAQNVLVTATAGTASGSYATVSAAFAAINAGTHQGAITMKVVNNTSEPAAPTALLKSTSPSNYTSVLITPFGGNYTISGAATPTANRAIIEMSGADNVTIDGDDPSITGTRNLTIAFPSTSATIASCIRVSSNSTLGADGASNNTIKNCIITGNRASAGTAATYGINMSNYSTTSLATGGYSSLNNRFENNLITRCYHGIWAVGASATYPNTGLQIINNVFGDGTVAGNIGNRGIIMSYTSANEAGSAIVRGNEVVGVGDPGTTGYAASIAGMEIGTVNFGAKIYNNYIHDVKQPTTGGYGAYGVLFSGATSCDSMRFYNNIITRITACNYTAAALSSFTNYGVKMTAGSTFGDFSNNTIVLSTANPTGTFVNPISYALSCDVNGVRLVNFRNNIIVNTNASTNAIGIYVNNNAIFNANNYAGGQIWDKNCYWVPSGAVGYSAASTPQTTFSAWKTAVSKDGTSFNINPSFVSATDLHINGSVASLLESGGMATSFNTDFDGQARPGPAGSVNGGATAFDIGADEFDGLPLIPVSITSASATGNSCTAIAHTVTATVVQGTNAVSSVVLSYTLNGTAQTPITMTNTSGSTWEATIPAASPTNATIAWTVTATDAVAAPTATGSYQDDALYGIGVTTSATPAAVCLGATSTLAASFYNPTAAPTSYTIQAVTNPTTDEDLGNVTITDASTSTVLLNNTSTYNSLVGTLGTATGTAGSYASYLTLATVPMTAGSTYNFSLSSLQGATAYVNAMAIYIDFNRDGDYADAGENVYVAAATTSGAHTETGSFTIPATANNGLTRMRVMINEGLITGPTMALSYGEREEYMVNISSANNGGGGNIPAFTYSWSDGTSVVGTTNPVTPTVNASATYTVTASTVAGCTISGSTAVTTIALPSAPTATNSVQCGPGVATASVASNTGLATPQYVWYAAQTGGTALQTSSANTYGTSISATTTLYVSENDGTCQSLRTPVTVTVNTPPSITTSGPATICQGQSTTLFALSSNPGYSYSWSNGGGAGASVSVSPLTTTNYVVTALDTTTGQANSGCTIASGATATTVTVNTAPVALTVTPTASSICNGASTTLNAVGGTISGAYINGGLNTVNATTGYPAPFSNYYGGTKTQWMYTAAELTAMGFASGDQITSLGLAVSAVGTTFTGTANGFTISMKNAGSLSALTSTFETGLTQVASLNWAVPTTGLPIWSYVTFSTPFTWNGGNLVVQTSYSNANSGTSTDFVQTYLTNTGSNYASYYRVDAATAATVLAATAATVSTNRPDCRLGYAKLPTWSWSPASSSTSSLTVSPTTTTSYTTTATAFNGCTATTSTSITVNPLPSLSNTTTSAVLCNGGSTGSITAVASGATAPYAFTLNGANGNSTGSYTGLAAGSYSVKATDANGCSTTTSFTVTQPTACSVSGTATSPTCNNGADGSISYSATGGVAPYSYTLNGTASTSPATGLAAGSYTIVSTDANGCTASTVVTVSNPAIPSLTATASAVNCFGGSSTLDATAGFTSYAWSGPNSFSASTQSASASDAGTYSLVATNANGCTATASATVTIPSALAASATATDALCNGGNGSIAVSATGGTTPYSGTGSNSVTAGTYSYTVTDANGCTASASATVAEPSALTAAATGNDVLCNGGSTTVTVSANGGTAPYTGTGNNTVNAGTYNYTVTDANGCTASASVTIAQPSALSATATATSATVCTGGTTSVTVVAAGGTSPYTGEGSFTQGAGSQTYSVADANGCTATSNAVAVTVSNNTITASAGSNGSISDAGTNTVACGTNKSFTITPAACYHVTDVLVDGNSVGAVTSYDFTNVSADHTIEASFAIDTYTITATAGSGGTITASATVNCGSNNTYTATADAGGQVESVTVNGTTTTYPAGTTTVSIDFNNVSGNNTIAAAFGVATCANPATASASATATVCSNLAYTLNGSIGGGATSGTWSTSGTGSFDNTAYGVGTTYTPSAADAAAGSVTLTLTTDDPDGAGSCLAASASTVLTINAAPSVSVSGTLAYCQGGSTNITASGASSYVWSTTETTASISATAGTYSVVGTAANGCTSSASATVVENANPSAPVISASSSAICAGASATLTSSYVGGNVWSNAATTDAITVSTAGSYSVTYTDANGCSSTSSATSITVNALPTVAITGTSAYCAGGNTLLTATGADTYVWSDNSTNATLVASAIGTYSVVGTDANGCSNSASVTVTENALPSASISGTAAICAGTSSTLSANATAGSGTITGYIWSLNGSTISGATGATYVANTAGNYAVKVINSNGCDYTSADFALTVNALPTAPVVSASGATTFCSGGSVTLTSDYVGGNTWSNGATTDAITVSAAGSYSVTYTDANGCSATSSATSVVVNTATASITGASTYCSGGATTLTASATPAAVGYAWSLNGTPTVTTNTASANAAGVYSVVTTDANGCTATASVTVSQAPTFTVAVTADCATPVTGNAVTLTATPSISGTFTYLWSNSLGTASTASTSTLGTFTATVTDQYGCTAAGSYTTSYGPLSGTYSIGSGCGSFTTLARVITHLNTYGVSGNVTINVPAGYTETAPAGGYQLKMCALAANLQTGPTRTLTIQKSGAGANPIITSGVGTSASIDAIFNIVGADNVTIDGINLTEAAGNTTATTRAEWGYGVLKCDGNNGANDVTIRNCNVALAAAYTGGNGIYVANHDNLSTTGFTNSTYTTTAQAARNKVTITNNTINNCYTGIRLGSNPNVVSTTGECLNDTLNNISNNTITNFGGGASAAYGIYYGNNRQITIRSNTISSSTTATSTTAAGIYALSGTWATICGNTIQNIVSSSTFYGIYHALAGGDATNPNIVRIDSNIIQTNVPTAGSFYGVYGSSTGGTNAQVSTSYNQFRNNTFASTSTATMYGMYQFNSGTNMVFNCNYNLIYNNTLQSTNTFYGIYGYATSGTYNCRYNNIRNNILSPSSGIAYILYASSSNETHLDYNNITNNRRVVAATATSVGTTYGIYGLAGSTLAGSINNNVIDTLYITGVPGTLTSLIYGLYYSATSAAGSTVNNNIIRNITTQGTSTGNQTIYASYFAPSGTNNTFKGNRIARIGTTTSTTGISTEAQLGGSMNSFVVGAQLAGSTTAGTTKYFEGNTFSSIIAGGSNGIARGVWVTTGQDWYIYNNAISRVNAPFASPATAPTASSSTTVTTGTAVHGIDIANATAGYNYYVYNNSVLLSGTGGGANFASSGIHANVTPNVTLVNNLVINNIASGSSQASVAYRRSGAGLTTYQSASDNNLFYAGTPGATKLIYGEGVGATTNAKQTLADFKTFVGPTRDANSRTEVATPFVAATTDSLLHIAATTATFVEGGGKPYPATALTTDIDGNTRNTTAPDIGADEGNFVGILPSIASATASPAIGQCTAVDHTVTVVTSASVTGVTLNYAYNGVAQTALVMSNGGSGSTWTAIIPAATPINANVTWSVVATDGTYTVNATGTAYKDAYLTGVTVGAIASPTSLCLGSTTNLIAGSANSPSATIGTGTSYSSSTSYPSMAGNYWYQDWQQFVYSAADLTAAGLVKGNISGLKFDVGVAASPTAVSGYSISLGSASSTTITAFKTTGLTTVFGPTTYTSTSGIVNVNFNTPYYWDGVSNIVVDIRGTGAYSSGNATVKVTTTATNTVAYAYTSANNASFWTSGPTPTFSTSRPNLIFNGVVAPVGFTTVWSDGTSTLGTGNPLVYTPTVAGTASYSATCTDANGCVIYTSPVSVTTSDIPAAPSATASTQCGTAIPSIKVSGAGAGTGYNWYLAATGGSPIQSGTVDSLSSYSISTTTTFYVSTQLTSTPYCESPRTAVVATVNTPDAITISSSANNVCPGTVVTLTANQTGSSNTYVYTWNGAGLNATSGNPVTATIAGVSNTFNVTAVDAALGCTTTATITVTGVTPPSISGYSATPSTVCAGQPVTLLGTTTVITSGPQTAPDYTTQGNPSFTATADEEIFNVTLGSINNTSNCSSVATGPGSVNSSYNNYTTTIPAATITAGQTYSASVTVGYCATNTYGNIACMFIDYNRDGDFLDAGETVWTKAYGTSALGGTAWPFNVTVPMTASPGVTRMRVVVIESTVAPTPNQSGSWGEGEDYLVNILAPGQAAGSYTWSWSDGSSVISSSNTVSVNPTVPTTYTVTATDPATGCTSSQTVTPTVNPLPAAPTATNSVQCGAGIPTASVASASGLSIPQFNWYSASTGGTLLQGPPSATGPLTTYYSNNFATSANGTITGSASLTGGRVQLTPNATSNLGGLQIAASGVNADKYSVDFKLTTSGGGGADGMSYSFGNDVSATSTTVNAEIGSGTKLSVGFDVYGGTPGAAGIRLIYGSTISNPGETVGTNGILAYSNNVSWVGGTDVPVNISINSVGKVTVTVNGTAIFTNVALPAAYLSANKATWQHVFKARTGGLSMVHAIDDVTLQQSSASAGYTTYQTPITSSTTFYVSEQNPTTGCQSARTPVEVTVNQPDSVAVSATVASANNCLGTTVTLTATNTGSTNNYAYSWNGGTSSGISTTQTGSTITVTPTAAGTYTYSMTATDVTAGCNYTNSISVTINANPTIDSISATPATICSGSNVTLRGYTMSAGPQVIPTGYCTGSPSTTIFADEQIFSVSFGPMTNTQSETCTTNYTNYTGTIPAVTAVAGQSYPFTVVTNECDGATYFSNGLSIYIDYNRDGDWDDAGEQAYTTTATTTSPNTRSGSIVIPATASPGLTRMRVVVQESVASPTQCPTFSYGEIEDYALNIIGLGNGGSTTSWTWDPGALTGNVATANPTASTVSTQTYTVVATNAAGCTAQNTVSVNVNPNPDAPTAVTGTICGFNAANVAVTSNSGATTPVMNWYLAPTGNSTLISGQTGLSLNAYYVSATDTFYVSETDNTTGCKSARTMVIQDVTQPDAITAASSAASICLPGASINLSATQTGSTNNYTYNWTAVPPVGSGLSGVQLGPVTTLFSNDFTNSTVPSNVNLNNDAVIIDGKLRLTDNILSSKGSVNVTAGGNAADTIAVDFDLIVPQNGADGISYSYCDDGVQNQTLQNNETGTGSKLAISFDSYTNGTNVAGIYVMYNATNQPTPTSSNVLAYSSNLSWRASATPVHVAYTIGSSGLFNLSLNGTPVFTNVQLPASYVAANKSTWSHWFKARTGGVSEEHSIDNLTVKVAQIQSLPTPGQNLTITPTLPGTYTYQVTGTDGACNAVSTVSVVVNPAAPSISAGSDLTICEGGNVTLNSASAGLIPALRFTEVLWQVNAGTGPTGASIPAWASTWYNANGGTTMDMIEITNLGSSQATSAGVTIEMWNATSTTTGLPAYTYTIPSNAPLMNSGGLLYFTHSGSAIVTDLTNNFYARGGTSIDNGSGTAAGMIMRKNGVIIDAVAVSGYTFPSVSGVTSADWSGTLASNSGLSGTVLIAADNNTASSWSNTSASLTASVGTLNSGLVANLPSLGTVSWSSTPSGFTGTEATSTFGPITVPTTFVVMFNNGTCQSYDTVVVTPASTPAVPVITSNKDSICTSGSALYTASNLTQGASLQWQSYNTATSTWVDIAGATTSIYATPTYAPVNGDTTVYFRLVTSCTNPAYSNVDTLQIVKPFITSTVGDTVCGGGTVDLVANGNGTMVWYANSTTTTVSGTGTTYSPFILSNSVYWVRAQVGTCLDAAGRLPVISISTPAPAVTIAPATAAICEGSSTTLTASSTDLAYVYTWNGGLGTGATVTAAPTSTTTYNVVGTNPTTGCIGSATVTVTVNQLPSTPVVTQSTAVACPGTSTTLTATSIGAGPQVAPTGYCTGTPSTTTFADEQIFGVTFGSMTNNQTENCSTNYSDYTSTIAPITVISGSSYPFSVITDECDGSPYYSSGLSIYIDYNRDGDWDDAGEQAYTTTTTTLSPNTRTGTVSIPSNASLGLTRMRVVVNESVTSPTQCPTFTYGEMEDYLVNITGPISSYNWSTGGTTASITVTPPAGSTTYTVSATSAAGCTSATGSYTVVTNPAPSPVLTATDTTLCAPNSINIYVVDNGTYASGYPAGTSVEWLGYGATGDPATTPINSSQGSTFQAKVTLPSGCYANSNTVTVTTRDIVVVPTITPAACGISNGKVKAQIASAPAAPYNYVWTDGTNTIRNVTSANTTDSITGLAPGTYYLSVYDNQGGSLSCSASNLAYTVGGSTPPVLAATSTNITCNGSGDGSVGVTITSGGAAPFTYSWSNGSTATSQLGLAAGTYTVTVSDVYGCSAEATVTVTEPTAISATETITQPCVGGTNGSIALNVSGGTGSVSVDWFDAAINQLTSGNTLSGIGAGTYYALMTDANSCTNIGEYTVTEVGQTYTTTESACDTYTWSQNSQSYTASGSYTSVSGCDTYVLNLTITPSTSNTTSETACDTYTWSVNGTTYTTSGTYSSVTGCHTEILNLTINTSTSNTTSETACDTYTWSANGTTYTTSGTYSSVTGCHTEILNLTINTSTSNTTSVSSCGSYVWSVNGNTYTQSGTYSSVSGCNTEYLNLTVTNVSISSLTPSSGSVGSTVVISGADFTGATGVSFNGTAATSYTVDNNGQITVTVPAGTTTGPVTVTVGLCSATSSGNFTVGTNATLNLKAYMQGYYAGSGLMVSVLENQGVSTNSNEVDTITVELYDGATGATLAASASGVILTDGTVSLSLPASVVGNDYYIAVKHRNTVATWSASAVTMGSTTSYDFTTAATQAYGDNMIEIETGVFAMYSGDMNQDEFVDPFDYGIYSDDNNNFASGYYATDLNGDGFVDPFDYAIYNENNNNFVMSSHP